VDYDRAFAPFGEVYDNFGAGTNNSFAGDTQDMIAGIYDTVARELHPTQGRWISPDPAGLGAVSLSNPQSWNRYAYVGNNPLTLTDPTGTGFDDNFNDFLKSDENSYFLEGVPSDVVTETCVVVANSEPGPQNGEQEAQNQDQTYNSVDKAAAASARADQALQKKNGSEYGSLVYSANGKTFKYTTPVTQGQKDTVDPFNTTGKPQSKIVDEGKAPIPAGTELYAETHSHPTNSGFSGEEIQRGHDLTIPAFHHPDFQGEYVGLPNGNVIKYDPATGKQYTFAPGQPQ
jgi:RHS repeat-associated protein